MCGLLYENNLGDPLLADTAGFLYKKIFDCNIEYINFYGPFKKSKKTFFNKLYDLFFGIILRILRIFLNNEKISELYYYKWLNSAYEGKFLDKYYLSKLENADMAVFAGGGIIECGNAHNYSVYIHKIVSLSYSLNIPVVFNAVGLVKNYKKDWKYDLMKKSLNFPNVIMISVRDSVSQINSDFMTRLKAFEVCDSGVWVSEMLNITKNPDSDVIGLGMVRENIFTQYFKDSGLGCEKLIDLWCEIIKELNLRGLKWRIFCNGNIADYNLGIKILNKLGIKESKEYIVPRPVSYIQLVKDISSFKGIICHRLHACIISYSLDIPSVALSWGKKLNDFYTNINYKNRCFDYTDFIPSKIADALEKAIEEGYDAEYKQKYRSTIIKSIENLKINRGEISAK